MASRIFQLNKFVIISIIIEWIDYKDFLKLFNVCNHKTCAVIERWLIDFHANFQKWLFPRSRKCIYSNEFIKWVCKWKFSVEECLIIINTLPEVALDVSIKRLKLSNVGTDLKKVRTLSLMLRSMDELYLGSADPFMVSRALFGRATLRVFHLTSSDNIEPVVVFISRMCPNLMDLQVETELSLPTLLSVIVHARKLQRLWYSEGDLNSKLSSMVFLLHCKPLFTELSISSLSATAATVLYSRLPSLTKLRLHNTSDAVVARLLSSCIQYVDLSIIHSLAGVCSITADLTRCTNLTSLEYDIGTLTFRNSLSTLRCCPLLRRLVVSVALKTEVDDVISISCLPLLEILHLRCIIVVDNVILAVARACRLLKYVSLVGNRGLTDASLSVLAECCTDLRELNVSGCALGDKTLSSIAIYLENLQVLNISRNSLATDSGVQRILCLPKLLLLVADKISLSPGIVIKIRELFDRNYRRYERYEVMKDVSFVCNA